MTNKETQRPTASSEIIAIVRSFTRPALTFFGLVSWVMLFANGYDIPEYFTILVSGMIVYWFGDRTYFKIKANSQK